MIKEIGLKDGCGGGGGEAFGESRSSKPAQSSRLYSGASFHHKLNEPRCAGMSPRWREPHGVFSACCRWIGGTMTPCWPECRLLVLPHQ